MTSPITPLLRPDRYFASRDRMAYWTGLGCWLVYVAVTLAGTYWFLQALAERTRSADVDVAAIASEVFMLMVDRLVFFPLLALLIAAGVMHYFASAADSKGTFTDAVGVAGWAFAPLVAAFVVNLSVARRGLRGQFFDGSDPATFAAETEAWALSLSGPGLLVVHLLATAWCVYILAFGTAGTHDVPLKETGYVAVVLGAAYLALFVF